MKTDIRNLSESGDVGWEDDAKLIQDARLAIFFSPQKIYYLELPSLKKNEKSYSIFSYKNSNAYTIKNGFGNVSVNG